MRDRSKRTTITVPVSVEFARRLRIYAASENMNQGIIIELAVTKYLDTQNKRNDKNEK
jgi:predicted transcriptional regulator